MCVIFSVSLTSKKEKALIRNIVNISFLTRNIHCFLFLFFYFVVRNFLFVFSIIMKVFSKSNVYNPMLVEVKLVNGRNFVLEF